MTNRRSRLAPSPTGALHLGNARTFLVNWALARQRGWELVLRMEDLDGPRVKPQAEAETLAVLAWLGLDHDGPVARQSDDLEPYRHVMRELASRGHVYACSLSRKQIEQAARAPHANEHELRFPPELRPATPASTFAREDTNYRLLVAPGTTDVEDAFAGASRHEPYEEVGDFVVWTRRAVPAYQLAVVVDDLRQGITDVVRGADLLPSAARQMLLYRAFEHDPPRWWHLPLVLGSDGRRLAKRHGDSRLTTYREAGVPAARVLGLLARWCGIGPARHPIDAATFLERFDIDRLSPDPVTFTPDDHQWLLHG